MDGTEFFLVPTKAFVMEEEVELVISVGDYRRITNDNKSTDEQIKKRIQYLQALSSNVIKNELKSYVKSKKG